MKNLILAILTAGLLMSCNPKSESGGPTEMDPRQIDVIPDDPDNGTMDDDPEDMNDPMDDSEDMNDPMDDSEDMNDPMDNDPADITVIPDDPEMEDGEAGADDTIITVDGVEYVRHYHQAGTDLTLSFEDNTTTHIVIFEEFTSDISDHGAVTRFQDGDEVSVELISDYNTYQGDVNLDKYGYEGTAEHVAIHVMTITTDLDGEWFLDDWIDSGRFDSNFVLFDLTRITIQASDVSDIEVHISDLEGNLDIDSYGFGVFKSLVIIELPINRNEYLRIEPLTDAPQSQYNSEYNADQITSLEQIEDEDVLRDFFGYDGTSTSLVGFLVEVTIEDEADKTKNLISVRTYPSISGANSLNIYYNPMSEEDDPDYVFDHTASPEVHIGSGNLYYYGNQVLGVLVVNPHYAEYGDVSHQQGYPTSDLISDVTHITDASVLISYGVDQADDNANLVGTLFKITLDNPEPIYTQADNIIVTTYDENGLITFVTISIHSEE